MNHNICIKWG